MNTRKRITLLSLLSALVLPLLVVLPAGPAQAANTVCGKWDNFSVEGSKRGGSASTRARICASAAPGVVRADAQAQSRDSLWSTVYENYELRVSILDGGRVVAKKTCRLTKEANEGQHDGGGSSYSQEKMHCKLVHEATRGRSYEVRTVLVFNRNNDGRGNRTKDNIDTVRVRA